MESKNIKNHGLDVNNHLYNLGDKFVIEISSVMLKKDGTYAYGIKKIKNVAFTEKELEALPRLESERKRK